jgi:hypothetical protein
MEKNVRIIEDATTPEGFHAMVEQPDGSWVRDAALSEQARRDHEAKSAARRLSEMWENRHADGQAVTLEDALKP